MPMSTLCRAVRVARPVTTALSVGPEVIADFSAGSDSAVVDTTTLNASTFGVTGANWEAVLPSPNLTYATAAKKAFGGNARPQSVNPWPGDLGTVGFSVAVPDATPRFIRFTYPGTVAPIVTAGVWFNTDYLATDTPNIDHFFIFGTVSNFVNAPLQGNGASLKITGEFAGVANGDIVGSPVLITPSTWYWIALRYSSDVLIPHAIRVYSAAFSLLGEMTATPTRSDLALRVSLGVGPAPVVVFGHTMRFSGFLTSYQSNCRWPLLPI